MVASICIYKNKASFILATLRLCFKFRGLLLMCILDVRGSYLVIYTLLYSALSLSLAGADGSLLVIMGLLRERSATLALMKVI